MAKRWLIYNLIFTKLFIYYFFLIFYILNFGFSQIIYSIWSMRHVKPRIIILGTFKLKVLSTVWEEVSLPESFDPKLNSFLIQIRDRMYMYSIHPSTSRWWILILGLTTKVDLKSIDNKSYKWNIWKLDLKKFKTSSIRVVL